MPKFRIKNETFNNNCKDKSCRNRLREAAVKGYTYIEHNDIPYYRTQLNDSFVTYHEAPLSSVTHHETPLVNVAYRETPTCNVMVVFELEEIKEIFNVEKFSSEYYKELNEIIKEAEAVLKEKMPDNNDDICLSKGYSLYRDDGYLPLFNVALRQLHIGIIARFKVTPKEGKKNA